MISERVLIACCTSGLANRLLIIAGAERLARLTERKLLIYWPENDQLGCTFAALFTNRLDQLRESDMHALLRSDRAMKVYNARDCAPLYENVSPDGDPSAEIVLIKGWTAPKFAGETLAAIRDELCENLRNFTPQEDLLAAAHDVSLPESCFGVHVRHGETWKYVDASVQSKHEHFEIIVSEVMRSCPRAGFVLATTQPDVEEKFRARFGERMVFLPKSSRSRDAAALREALVDLLLLSRTRAILGTYGSTYSQVAAMLGPKILSVASRETATVRLPEMTQLFSSALNGTANPHLEL